MEQHELMRLIIQALESLKIPYMIAGSLASMYYGEPRFTRDIDIVSDLKEGKIDAFADFFPATEFYCDVDTIKKAVKTQGQFNIIHADSGLKIDMILPKKTAFSQTEISRRKRVMAFPDLEANFASPEDVIIKKNGMRASSQWVAWLDRIKGFETGPMRG